MLISKFVSNKTNYKILCQALYKLAGGEKGSRNRISERSAKNASKRNLTK